MAYNDLDPNRPVTEPYPRRPIDDTSRSSWAPLVALAAMAAIFGFVFLMPASDRTTTASNEAPISRQTTPITPAPAATPPARTQ